MPLGGLLPYPERDDLLMGPYGTPPPETGQVPPAATGPFAPAPAPAPTMPEVDGPFAPPAKPAAPNWQRLIAMAIPAILGTFSAKRAPHETAAALRGFMGGLEKRRAEMESQEERAQRHLRERADFQARSFGQLAELDPALHEAYIDYVASVGSSLYGLDDNELRTVFGKVTGPAKSAKAKAEAAAVVKRNDELAEGRPWSAPDPTTGEMKPDRWWRQQAGQTGVGADGQPLRPSVKDAFTASTPDKLLIDAYAREKGKTVEELTAAEIAEARALGKTATDTAPAIGTFEDYVVQKYGPRPTPAQIEEARKAYNQADDRPRVTVDLGGRDPKAVATFNQIAGAYERSPLIRASDRTVVLRDAIAAIERNASDPASQLNLAYSYIQALDTYQSAVREGELQNLGVLGTRLQSFVTELNRVATEGAFLHPDVAKNIAANAKQLVQTIESGRTQKQREFASRAKVSGVGEMWDEFVGGFAEPAAAPPARGRGAQPRVGERRMINGQLGEWDGKGWKPVGGAK